MSEFIEKIKSELEDENSEVTIYKIANYPADYTLQGLYDKEKDREIVIPSFQRKFVWTLSQSSKFIESFLLGLPVPNIFLYKEKKSQKLLVIDGQQRLKTIFGYFSNTFPDTKKSFRLKDVSKKWNGKNFLELEDSDKRRLKDAVLRAVIVEQMDPQDNSSIFHIFQRLNSGGTILNAQEIRNCIYQGEFSNLLNDLNLYPNWRKIIALPKPHKRMRDIELILRFIALLFSYKGEYSQYQPPMRDFLSNFMSLYRNNKDKIKEFEQIFKKTVDEVALRLEERPFIIKTGLHAAVFDSIMVAFALNLNNIPNDIKNRHKELLKDSEYEKIVSSFTTDTHNVKQRIEFTIKKLFNSYGRIFRKEF